MSEGNICIAESLRRLVKIFSTWGTEEIAGLWFARSGIVPTLIKKLTHINRCLTDPANQCLTDIN